MRCVVASCIVAACGMPLSAFAQGPFTQSQQLDVAQLTFTGANRADRPVFVSDAGDVFGVTRTDVNVADNEFTTSAVWRANAAGADIVTIGGSQFSEPTTGAYLNFALAANTRGQAIGVQYSGSDDTPAFFNRLNAWFFDGVNTRAVGIRAADIASVTPFSEDLAPIALSESGAVIGRYTSTVPPPSDFLPFGAIVNVAWVSFNGVNTPLGLDTGPYLRPFVNQRSSGVSAINSRNQIAGHSDRFNASAEIEGRTAWRYDLTTGQYVTMGLSGPDYVDPAQGVLGASVATMIADDGTVAGVADIVPDSRATGVWVFRDNQTVEVGLRGPAFGFEGREPSSQLLMLTNTGIALGTTSRELFEGFAGDVVWAAVDGVTRRMGPATPDFIGPAGEELSDFDDANDRGLVGGSTQTYNAAEGTFGLSRLAWVQSAVAPSSTATVLALTDALHTGPTGQRGSQVLDINNEGFVLGRSFQFGSPRLPNGGIPASANTPWLYDSRTGTLTAVPIPPTRSGRSSGFGLYLTPRGGVVGLFLTEVASDNTESYRPFYWSANAGFVDLAPAGPVYTSPWDTDFPIAVSPDGTRVVVGATLLTGDINLLRININDAGCDSIDFNNNQVFPEEQDVIDFFNVLAGGGCSTQNCSDIDFNNNQVFPEEQDIIDFFNVLAGGTCS